MDVRILYQFERGGDGWRVVSNMIILYPLTQGLKFHSVWNCYRDSYWDSMIHHLLWAACVWAMPAVSTPCNANMQGV